MQAATSRRLPPTHTHTCACTYMHAFTHMYAYMCTPTPTPRARKALTAGAPGRGLHRLHLVVLHVQGRPIIQVQLQGLLQGLVQRSLRGPWRLRRWQVALVLLFLFLLLPPLLSCMPISAMLHVAQPRTLPAGTGAKLGDCISALHLRAVCACACVRACVCGRVRACVHAYMHTCVVRVRAYVRACVCVHVCIHMCVHACVCVRVCACNVVGTAQEAPCTSA